MKKYFAVLLTAFLAISFTSRTLVAHEEGSKMKPTPEMLEKKAEAFKKAADCLRSGKAEEECMKDLHQGMGMEGKHCEKCEKGKCDKDKNGKKHCCKGKKNCPHDHDKSKEDKKD